MAQHGYLHDSYDNDDFDGGEHRRSDWRRHQGGSSHWSERGEDRGPMFGWSDDDHRGPRHDNHDRAPIDRSRGRGTGSWMHDEPRGSHWGGDWHGMDRDYSGHRDHSPFTSYGDHNRSYSAHPDDHYRSWRDKQMEALDRDYEAYCREREQQFHQDFDSWRSNRRQQGSSDQSGSRGGRSEEAMELDNPAVQGGEIRGATTSAMDAATLGTNNSENTASAPAATGRGRP